MIGGHSFSKNARVDDFPALVGPEQDVVDLPRRSLDGNCRQD